MLHIDKLKNNILYRFHLYLHLKNKVLLTILLQFSLVFLLNNSPSFYITNHTECFTIHSTIMDSALSHMESGRSQNSTPITTTPNFDYRPFIILVGATSFWGTVIYIWLRFF